MITITYCTNHNYTCRAVLVLGSYRSLKMNASLMTHAPIIPFETRAFTTFVIANSSTRTFSSSFIPITIQRIGARGTLLLVASGSSISRITQTSHVFKSIPWLGIYSPCSMSEYFLRPTGTSVVAVIGTNTSLTCNAVISCEAFTLARLSVAKTFIRTLHPWMQIICSHNTSDPSEVFRTSSKGTISTSVGRFTVHS